MLQRVFFNAMTYLLQLLPGVVADPPVPRIILLSYCAFLFCFGVFTRLLKVFLVFWILVKRRILFTSVEMLSVRDDLLFIIQRELLEKNLDFYMWQGCCHWRWFSPVLKDKIRVLDPGVGLTYFIIISTNWCYAMNAVPGPCMQTTFRSKFRVLGSGLGIENIEALLTAVLHFWQRSLCPHK